jgi:hypothetical protein
MIAVPSMLTVVPIGRTNDVTSLETLSRFDTHSMFMGRDAALDEVPNAVRSAGRLARRKSPKVSFVKSRITSWYTPNRCRARPVSTTRA